MRDELRDRLRALGATDDDLERAAAEGWLPLLAVDRMLMPGERRYDLAALAAAAGIGEELARRLWRAVGFPDVPAGLALFTDHDVAAARLALAQGAVPGPDDEEHTTLLQRTRVISGSLARVATLEADGVAETLDALRAQGRSDEEVALAMLAEPGFANIGALIDYVHRLQLRAAVWRRSVLSAASDVAVAIGFADLSGYTRLSARLDAAALSSLVGLWEAVAYDAIAANGARVVKTIGDEVMFVGLPDGTVAAALALLDAAAAERLPELRIGIAAGPVVGRDGDYFGPVVNLASRLTEVAAAGEVLAPAGLRAELSETAAATLRFADRGTRELRDIGAVGICAVSRAG